MKEKFYQSETITYPTGTVARAHRQEIILDQGYENCVGLCIIEVEDGGIPTYRVGVEDRNKTIISPLNKDFLQSDKAAGLNLENRVIPVNIRAEGNKIKFITDIPEETTEKLEYDVVLVLEREQKK